MIAALIIAAGKTAEKDGFSPQKEVGAIPAIERIVLLFQRAGLDRVVIVCDDNEDETKKLAAYLNVIFLHHRKDTEMLDSVKTGLAYLQDKCTAAMITHTDVPMFSVDTLYALMAAQGQICIPSYHGSQGHPILLQAAVFQSVLSYTGEGGLAGAIRASDLQRSLIEVEDEGILSHVDNESSYSHLLAGHSLRHSYPDVRIRIRREKSFYSPEAHQLMQVIDETGSVREACRRIGISYGKGRMILALMEQQLGYLVIESQQGGSKGGSSVLTDRGRSFMEKYAAFCLAANQSTQELFSRYFDD